MNPFGATTDNEKEEVLWRRYAGGREYVHMPLLEVCYQIPVPRIIETRQRSIASRCSLHRPRSHPSHLVIFRFYTIHLLLRRGIRLALSPHAHTATFEYKKSAEPARRRGAPQMAREGLRGIGHRRGGEYLLLE